MSRLTEDNYSAIREVAKSYSQLPFNLSDPFCFGRTKLHLETLGKNCGLTPMYVEIDVLNKKIESMIASMTVDQKNAYHQRNRVFKEAA